MLPCGRYYYDPEGGYVETWVKISYQFVYLYLGWIIHHLDLFDHYIFQFTQTLIRNVIYNSRTLAVALNKSNNTSDVFEK